MSNQKVLVAGSGKSGIAAAKLLLMLEGDRRMVRDDVVSKKLTLKKGRNILRGAVINGPGMSDFCIRFIDGQGKPVRNLSIHVK